MTSTFFDRVGGLPFFEELVENFYVGVMTDELLRPMYPEDLTESKLHLALFLAQYWGGPRTYQEERGHPRLRMRHAPFRITKRARDAWLLHMSKALDLSSTAIAPQDRDELLAYFTMAANQLRNV